MGSWKEEKEVHGQVLAIPTVKELLRAFPSNLGRDILTMNYYSDIMSCKSKSCEFSSGY